MSIGISNEESIFVFVLLVVSFFSWEQESEINNSIKTKYKRIQSSSMVEVDKELYTLNNNDDERKLFINILTNL